MANPDNIFSPSSEKDITRAILSAFSAELDSYVESDVTIIGAGPSGLVCGRALASQGIKVLIVERNNYCGGGFWIGGYLMNKLTIRAPAQTMLDELGVPYQESSPDLFVADGPHACAKLIGAACDAGVKILNMTSFDDLVLAQDGQVNGAVINWSAVKALPRQISCVDPVAIECKILVDASGHDAVAATRLKELGMLEVPGCGPMAVVRSEDAVVKKTGFVYPGLMVIGMAVSSTYGLPRMGPTFGSMLLSGVRAAELILENLQTAKDKQKASATA